MSSPLPSPLRIQLNHRDLPAHQPPTRETNAVEFRDDPENHRYLATSNGEIAALAVYHIRNDRYLFVHTEVRPGYEGEGVGSDLARFALDDARARGVSIVPVCPFIAGWMERHPEYQDLVDQEILARINGA
jgi:uncharacterized protein